MTPPVLSTLEALRAAVAAWRQQGLTVALVPTMGALHTGHRVLIARAAATADRVLVSIFVNPTQFGAGEDFDRYPRQMAADLAAVAAAGGHAVWAPAPQVMYPRGFVTTVAVPGLSDQLCGAFRPGHFAGVAQVVAKLLNQARADWALFGEKDYQQLCVIRRMARDLDIETEILGVETVREADGLALSSRNAYLTPDERARAPALQRGLAEARAAILAGTPVPTALAAAAKALAAAGFAPVQYVSLVDAETLGPVTGAPQAPCRVMAAAYLGTTRLIDNLPVPAMSRA